MISLVRKKNHKWILQKNVSSRAIIQSYLAVISNSDTGIDYANVQQQLKIKNIYRGRSYHGCINTMGVRFSQMCFYMFGYKVNDYFIPSIMTQNMLNPNSSISSESNSLINLFSMQYPHPYSKTHADFKLYIGRLFIKLLLEERLESKLYIDEIIWFLPFIDTVNETIYTELVNSILEFRRLSFYQKKQLFESVKDYNDVFSNVVHEFNYYFLRIFKGFGVIDIIGEEEHNNGHLFSFLHGNTETYRNDAFDSGEKYSGFVKLSDKVLEDAIKLNSSFSAFDEPTTMNTEGINSERDWLISLYETDPLAYINCISKKFDRTKHVSDCINKMVYASKYGSRDGKDFEKSLQPVIELFRENCNVEIIAGAGNTDLLCSMEDADESIYKMNVDAKTRKVGLEGINARRIENHINKHGSKFCIIVAPRFAAGISGDIVGYKIVTIKAEDLGAYCYKECTSSADGFADFESLHKIIKSNMGTDITECVRELTTQKYGISI